MQISLSTPAEDVVDTVVGVLAAWQSDATTHHLHPGDIGWHRRFGPDKTASSLRYWSNEDGTILAIGLLDGQDLLRVTTAPSARRNELLAQAMVADITDPAKGVLGAGEVSIDIAPDCLLRDKLASLEDWSDGEEWVWMRKDATAASSMHTAPTLSFEVVTTEDQIVQRVEIQKLAFSNSSFDFGKWHAMAATTTYKTAKCLLAYQVEPAESIPVAAATIWSAGVGRPGLLEPVGVSAAHRGHGIGKALCCAAAEHLIHKMGASSALVATPMDNHAAVRTYQAAGFDKVRITRDLTRRK